MSWFPWLDLSILALLAGVVVYGWLFPANYQLHLNRKQRIKRIIGKQ